MKFEIEGSPRIPEPINVLRLRQNTNTISLVARNLETRLEKVLAAFDRALTGEGVMTVWTESLERMNITFKVDGCEL